LFFCSVAGTGAQSAALFARERRIWSVAGKNGVGSGVIAANAAEKNRIEQSGQRNPGGVTFHS